jgi:nitrate/nitrite-specific signal transduction histidine kinase
MADDKYLVLSAAHYTRKYSAFPNEEKEEILFTLRHGKTTIVAHCQAWDVNNNCAELKVGQDYEMKRAGRGFDTLSTDDRHIVLAIEKETLGQS